MTIDYKEAVIYKIVCNDLDIKHCYVGATCHFRARKRKHKSDCNNPKKENLKIYKFINENGGWDNWDMVMIEEFVECENRLQLVAKERRYVEELGALLNNNRPSRTRQEYRNDNKVKLNDNQKRYYHNRASEDKKQDIIKRDFYRNKPENKSKMKIYKNLYDKVKQNCMCGALYRNTNSDKARHIKTKKHKEFYLLLDNI